jgi:hypothetical protein
MLTAEERAEIAAYEDRALPQAEFDARAAAPMTDWEREDVDGLIDWFTRRYPTAGERMRAIRRRVLQQRAR